MLSARSRWRSRRHRSDSTRDLALPLPILSRSCSATRPPIAIAPPLHNPIVAFLVARILVLANGDQPVAVGQQPPVAGRDRRGENRARRPPSRSRAARASLRACAARPAAYRRTPRPDRRRRARFRRGRSGLHAQCRADRAGHKLPRRRAHGVPLARRRPAPGRSRQQAHAPCLPAPRQAHAKACWRRRPGAAPWAARSASA